MDLIDTIQRKKRFLKYKMFLKNLIVALSFTYAQEVGPGDLETDLEIENGNSN